MTTTTTTAKTQARYDLEFMARLLNVEQTERAPACEHGNFRCDVAHHRPLTDEKLAAAIAERAADPIASARAQRRIFDLAMELPRAQVQP